MVAGFSGRTARTPCFAKISAAVSKIDGHGSDQSMISAAVRHGSFRPETTSGSSGLPCVGFGHTMGRLSRRAMTNRRLRIVGAPKSQARSSRHSTR